MTTYTAATYLKAQFNITAGMSDTQAEVIWDGAVNMLNAFNADIDNLSGSAGSKTGVYTSAEVGKIMAVAQQIYQKHYLNASGANSNMGNYALTYSNDYQLLNFAKVLARQNQNNPPILIANEPVENE